MVPFLKLTGTPVTVLTAGTDPVRVTSADVPCDGVYVRAVCDTTGIGSNTGVAYIGPSSTSPIHYAVAPSDVAGFPIRGIQNLNQLYVQTPVAGQTIVVVPLMRG